MGCYIKVEDELRNDHPTWEWGLGGNRDYASLYYKLPHETEQDEFNFHEETIRPTDFQVWREAIQSAGLKNMKAHLELMDILEHDPRWRIRVSW